ncbi:MAG: ABC transporter permease subunit, partial [Deltaproteobacteria bacterium]|nr:ABC transporter permease subunit [Deltaproteobacteria bacterium]
MDEWNFFIKEVVPALNRGLVHSMWLILPSASIGLCLGALVGTLRAYGPLPLRKACDIYATVFRGTPLLVQLF